ncbi:Tricyclene synthase- chloroplastic [Striga hermonthica]|uniref:Tricyclene synthase- chloroplastic n=1 Tax=Striga hermonthica TaxID=68872 RepID=A0A9N7NU10_STRHE|nr:Tricyclene synthase- chloroplastic [Striga hermonthica]
MLFHRVSPSYIINVNGFKNRYSSSLQCKAVASVPTVAQTRRRSGNYKPPLWDFDFIQSLTTEYKEEKHSKRVTELVTQANKLLDEKMGPIQQLELIDDLSRLGISYHFEDKIIQILNNLYTSITSCEGDDLYSTALEFRVLRQHGFQLSQDVFDAFKNENGDFDLSSLGTYNDKGLLELYEASFLSTAAEETLELAKEFTTNVLKSKIELINRAFEHDQYLFSLARHSLEVPSHWRIPRLDARWFMDTYKTRPDMNPLLLELAKLDFNIIQATHQQELQLVSRWWEQTGLAKALPFARDRVVECYLLAIGDLFQPQYGYSRIMNAKVNVLVTIIDDMFDVYGTLDELHLFNDVVQRWDVDGIEKLPDYMRMCFLALNNFVNEMAYDVLKEHGVFVIPHLRRSWADLCQTYIREAEWFSVGHKPTLKEYISSAWISISVPVMLCHSYFLVTDEPIENEAVQGLFKHDNIVRLSGMVARLANDLGTSTDEMERGDVPKSVQCYMNETGSTREEARAFIKSWICDLWKNINEARVANHPFPKNLVRVAVDFARIALYVYQYGDGHGTQDPKTKTKGRISDLLFSPIV